MNNHTADNKNFNQSKIKDIKNRVDIYLSARKYQTCENYLKDLIKNKNNHSEIYNLLGLVYHKQSKFNLALEQFKLSWQRDPNFLEGRLNYTVTLCDLGEYQAAKQNVEKFHDYHDKKFKKPYATLKKLAQKHERLGDDYIACKMDHHALLEYQKASYLYKNKPSSLLKMSAIYVNSKNYAKAIPILEKLLNYDNYRQHALAFLGIISYYTNDTNQTIQYWTDKDHIDYFENFNQSQTDSYIAFNALAKFWQSHPSYTNYPQKNTTSTNGIASNTARSSTFN